MTGAGMAATLPPGSDSAAVSIWQVCVQSDVLELENRQLESQAPESSGH